MLRPALVAGALALLAIPAVLFYSPASARCFSEVRPILPTIDSVRANLTGGAAGLEVYQAVSDGDTARVASLLAADPALLATRTVLPEGTRPYAGNTGDLLTAAVARCDGAMVAALLQAGADPDGAIPGIALTYALLANEMDLATILLNAGADPDAHMEGTNTPLREALLYERAGAVTLLAAHGADLNRPDAVGSIPLDTPFVNDPWPMYQALIEAGANPWQVSNQGVLPAFMIFSREATSSGDRAIRDALIARLQQGAPMWPPVNASEVRARFLDGSWPTPEMRDAGLFASPEAMAMMRRVGP